MNTFAHKPLTPADLPLLMPTPCPICDARVYLTSVDEWGADPEREGLIVHASFDCETEPDIDGDDWMHWHKCHYAMPYVDWLPYEQAALKWLARRYRWRPDR